MQEIFVQLTWESLIPPIPIYTIGYGGRSMSQFLELLHRYGIEFLIDVRSHPHSRTNQQFSKSTLEGALCQNGVRYVFMGDTLGGRPDNSTCYVDRRVNYAKVREMEFYQQGVSRLRIAWEKQIPVALMCAEIKPQECHRSKLIGNTLHEQDIVVAHIDEIGELKTQDDVNKLLLSKQISLFEDQQSSFMLNEGINFSRKRYFLPGSEAR